MHFLDAAMRAGLLDEFCKISNVQSPSVALHKAQRVGQPSLSKLGPPPVPEGRSLQQIAKPKGPGFGLPAPATTKS